jgi:L-lactate dehydrogenase complex protein LldG
VAGALTTARDVILARIADALRDVPDDERPGDVDVPRSYLRTEPGDTVERFVERIAEYKTTVLRVGPDDVSNVVTERCAVRGVARLGIPSDLPEEWRPAGVELVPAEVLDARALDALDGALTGCALAIAETGTIVLDAGARQGGRALSLVPDYHVCVVEEEQIVGGVPEAIARITPSIRRLLRPVTFISGPSATSDIELSRVEGVHGPRMLDVVVVRRR